MALHVRYTMPFSSQAEPIRTQVKFRRHDLLWRHNRPITSPYTGKTVEELPIRIGVPGKEVFVGPTILDMLVLERLPLDNLPDSLKASFLLANPADAQAGADDAEEEAADVSVAVWHVRDPDTLWPAPKPEPRPKLKPRPLDRPVDHPFIRSLASGGISADAGPSGVGFVTVQKLTTTTISEMTVRLAVGMEGSIPDAHRLISELAEEAWDRDLERVLKIWDEVTSSPDRMVLADPAWQPVSSISQEVERLIMAKCCTWLGVDPELDVRRGRGRPRAEAGDEGDVIRLKLASDGSVTGVFKSDFNGVAAGTELSGLRLEVLVEVLGALRVDDLGKDADLLEAYLDVASPDWRDQATSGGNHDDIGGPSGSDPYEILGVARNAPLEEIKEAYRKAMKRVHPDYSGLDTTWLSAVVADAYRRIKKERG